MRTTVLAKSLARFKKWKWKDFEVKLACAALAVNFGAVIYSIYLHRPLFGDACAHLYKILEWKTTSSGGVGRYITHLIHLPAVLAREAGASMDVVVRTYESSVSLHPFLSLLACLLIAGKKKRFDLMVFPMLSFATSGQFSQAFTFGTVHEVSSIFWPAFLYFHTADTSKITSKILMATMLFALAITHEVAIFCFAAFIVLAVKRLKKSKDTFDQMVIAASSLAIVWCIAKLWLFSVYVPGEFFTPMVLFRDPFPITGTLSALSLIVFFSLEKTKYSHMRNLFVAIAIILPLTSIFLENNVTIWNARNIRGAIIPLASLLAVGSVLTFHSSSWNRKIIYTTIVALLTAATIRDLRISENWNFIATFVKQTTNETRGFVKVPDITMKKLAGKGMRHQTLPLLSFMIALERKPTTILFSTANYKFCENLQNNRLQVLTNKGGFRFMENFISFPRVACPTSYYSQIH